MAVFSFTPLYSVPSPSPVPQSEFGEEARLRTASRALRTGRVTGSALSQRSHDEPPCPASIPSKYRTVFYQLTENKGFQMQSPRFEPNKYSTEAPSPGTYDIAHDTLVRNDTSLSTKGTCHFGSKTKRFSKGMSTVLGPASYFPMIQKNDFNQSTVSRLFKEPVTHQVESQPMTPSPNKYDLRSGENPGQQQDYSIFKSKTPRMLDTACGVNSNPGPGHYNVDVTPTQALPVQYSSAFKSKSMRAGFKPNESSPGPADYSPFCNTKQQHKATTTVRRHALTLSAPAQVISPPPDLPGPGAYQTTERVRSVQGKKTRSKSDYGFKQSACFKSIGREFQKQGDVDIPGPASYKPRTIASRHSFIQNPSQRWI